MREVITNAFCRLCLHKEGVNGRLQDFVITFDTEPMTVEQVVGWTHRMFHQLMENYEMGTVKVRLVACVRYERLNERHEVIGTERYHFGSYSAEPVDDIDDFYTRHMYKIALHMDVFHKNGSRLKIGGIEAVHINVTQCPFLRSTAS